MMIVLVDGEHTDVDHDFGVLKHRQAMHRAEVAHAAAFHVKSRQSVLLGRQLETLQFD